MSEKSKTCLHPRTSRRLHAVEIAIRCAVCGELHKAWLNGRNYKIVEDELEYELQDIDDLDLEPVKTIKELLQK